MCMLIVQGKTTQIRLRPPNTAYTLSLELVTAMQDIWMNFTVDCIQSLYNSMPHTILAIIRSKVNLVTYFYFVYFNIFKEKQLKYVYVRHLVFANTYEAALYMYRYSVWRFLYLIIIQLWTYCKHFLCKILLLNRKLWILRIVSCVCSIKSNLSWTLAIQDFWNIPSM